MCLPRGIDAPEGTVVRGGGSGGGSDGRVEVPDKAYKPNPGVVESFTHSKKVGNYLIGRELGSGSFATVAEGLHAVTGERVAIKIVSKETAKTDTYVAKNMRREGCILQLIRHTNVVQLLEVMETENSYYLVLELCHGGDFMSHLIKRRRLTEAEARRFLRQIVQAVDYIHSLGILHRDLKIENLLLTQDQNVKIIDFGLSNMVQAVPDENGNIITQLCRTQCGSPAYAAPEVLAKKTYGTAVDVWSIGVNMFAMLTGNLPFTVKPYSIKALHHKMVNQELNPLPKTLSAGCRDLMMRLLNPQPETRIKLKDVMNHPWLNENVSRLRSSPFPNLMTREDLRQDILQQVSQQLLVPVSEVARKVLDNTPGPCLSTYHLLVVKADRYCRQNPVAKIQSLIRCDEGRQSSAEAPTSADQAATTTVDAKRGSSSSVDRQMCSPNKEPTSQASASPPLSAGLLRREKTIAGCVPLSNEAADASELLSLGRGVSDSRGSGSQTARPALLPKCPANYLVTQPPRRYHRLRSGATPAAAKPRTPPVRWTESDRGCRTARVAAPAAAPSPPPPPAVPLLRGIRTTDSGRSSIQSLVSQRYALTALAANAAAATRAAAAAAAAAATATATTAGPKRSLISANFKAAAAGGTAARRFSLVALKGVADSSCAQFIRR